MRIFLTATLLAGSAIAAVPPALDAEALKPVLAHSWAVGESCDGEVMDFVIDTDGWAYQRAGGGFTPLSAFSVEGDQVTAVDEVGIGRTVSLYRFNPGGTLRLMSEIYDPNFGEPAEGPDAEPVTQRVKDGLIVIDEDGQAVSPGASTPDMKACPQRTAMFSEDIIAALDGAWATGDGAGGICAIGADSITFDLTRPVPQIRRGPFGEETLSTSFALAIAKDGDAFVVTEGSAFEAADYTFTPDGRGGMVQANPYADGPVELHRCP